MSRSEGVVLDHTLYFCVFAFIFNILLYSSPHCTWVCGRTKRLLLDHLETYFLLSKILS